MERDLQRLSVLVQDSDSMCAQKDRQIEVMEKKLKLMKRDIERRE